MLETVFSWKALDVRNAVPRLKGTGRRPLSFCAWSISMLAEVCRIERLAIFYLRIRLPPYEPGTFFNVSVASATRASRVLLGASYRNTLLVLPVSVSFRC